MISPYLKLLGMFETKEGPTVTTYGDVNEDVYSWKQYNGTGNTTLNSHGL